MKKRMWQILLALCLVGTAAALGTLAYQNNLKKKNEQMLNQLAEHTKTEPPAEITQEALPEARSETPAEKNREDMTLEEKRLELEERLGVEVPAKELDFEELCREVNPDIYAWITIPDTKIDYPVLQHPEDNLYYLNYNLDGSKGYPGCIYTENYNQKDFTDPNTVLYGHNMKDGSMFAGLHRYADSEYFEEHPYVFVYTREDILAYEIFAAYRFNNTHLILSFDLKTPEIFEGYLNGILEQKGIGVNLRKDVELDARSRLITLSTCVANKPEERFLVQGVLVREN